MTTGPSGPQGRTRTRGWPWVDVSEVDVSTQPFLIDGVVSSDLTVLSGEPETGKTFLAGHIAHAVYDGTPILGRSIIGPTGPALILSGDGQSHAEWGLRWGHAARGSLLLSPAIQEMGDEDLADLAGEAMYGGVRLVVVDNLNELAGSDFDLNTRQDAHVAMSRLQPFRSVGIPVLLIAHAGNPSSDYSGRPRSSARPAGSYGIRAAARHRLELSGTVGQRQALQVRSNGWPAERLDIKINLADTVELLGQSNPRQRSDEARDRRVSLITEGGPLTISEACELLVAKDPALNSPGSARQAINNLRDGQYPALEIRDGRLYRTNVAM